MNETKSSISKPWYEEVKLMDSKGRCLVCKRGTLGVKSAWHFSDDFHFCNNKCVYIFLNKFLTRMRTLDTRIMKLERKLLPQ